MTNEERVKLWDAIDKYVASCGGDTSKHVYGNTARQLAVVEVETVVREVERRACERSAELVRRFRSQMAEYIKKGGAGRRVIGSNDVREMLSALADAVESMKE